MTEEEYIAAAKCGIPVNCNGVRYERISAIRFPKKGRGRVMLELQDVNGASVTLAQPEAVEPVDRQMFEIVKSMIRMQK